MTASESHAADSATAEAKAAAQVALPVGVQAIENLLPHRYPFLLIDRVVALEPGKRVIAHKCVTINEPFFQGHFPGHPVMPGVLVVEALAQAGGALHQLSTGGSGNGRIFYLVKIDNAKFNKVVIPGDRLELEVEITRRIRNMVQYKGVARVDGHTVASAEFLCAEAKD